jgi:hypothetical protein
VTHDRTGLIANEPPFVEEAPHEVDVFADAKELIEAIAERRTPHH